MYSTRTTSRPLKVNNIDALPLAEIAATYSALMASTYEEWEAKREEYKAYLISKFETDYNGTSEAPYEGDYEHLKLDEQCDARFGTGCAELGSTQQAELDAYLTAFSTKYAIKKNAEWFFEQMTAKFAEVNLIKTEDGKIDSVAMFREIRKSPFMSGCLVIAIQNSKSTFITGQTDPKFRNYGTLVPLVLSSFKRYRNIPYSMWTKHGLMRLVAPNLLKAMSLEELPDVTREEVIEIRNAALTPKTGNKMGVMASPVTTYRLYVPAGTPLSGIPQLAQIMLCQTWLAHPTVRTEYMVLNPVDWDDMPEPLIGTAVTRRPTKTATTSHSEW